MINVKMSFTEWLAERVRILDGGFATELEKDGKCIQSKVSFVKKLVKSIHVFACRRSRCSGRVLCCWKTNSLWWMPTNGPSNLIHFKN
jgi:hypothetical protein